MEIHKPKPIRNWRELLSEIGVIVLSVCIALAAEQAVEWWHWKNRVRDAAETMRLELRDDNGPQAYTRMAMVNCYAGQLDVLQHAIESGHSRQEIVALIKVYLPQNPTWDSNAWNAVMSSDVGSHVPPAQMMTWAGPYSFIPALDKRNMQERDDRIALQPTHLEGEKLSPAEAETMLAAIARLRSDNLGMARFSGSLLRRMGENGIALGDDQEKYRLRVLRERFGNCVVVPSLALTNVPGAIPFFSALKNSHVPGN